MIYHSTHFDNDLCYLILRGKQKKKKLKQTLIQSSSQISMVGTIRIAGAVHVTRNDPTTLIQYNQFQEEEYRKIIINFFSNFRFQLFFSNVGLNYIENFKNDR